MRQWFFIALIIQLFSSCSPTASTHDSTTQTASILQPTYDAHGGLDAWQTFKGLEFDYISERGEASDTQHIITDLQTRKELIRSSSARIGFDGRDYWKTMLDSTVNNTDPKFVINLQFYFFAMPFVLADPGVRLESLGKKKIGQQDYDAVKVTFGDSIGVAPRDQYILYLDEVSKRLSALLYSVTYFNPDNAEKYSALVYTDWQEIEGILLPQKIGRRNWLEDQQVMGSSKGTKIFENVRLMTEEPKTELFNSH